MKQEELPSIDDDCYQLEVSDYVDEIYLYYWVSEAQNPPLENFMLIQADITPYMRGILVNWLIEVHFKFELMQETLLMVTLLDQYLSQVAIKKDEMQLVGLTAQSWHQNTRIFGILGDCAEMILKVQKVARVGWLKVTYEKYMRPDLSGVAAIKPLERLPL
ncbi:hypothetical protein ACE6H2_014059 [Prunus campanulata]